MGVWVDLGDKIMEVTMFETMNTEKMNDKGKLVPTGMGVVFFSPDGDCAKKYYDTVEKAKMVFDKLKERVARLEILSRCIQGFDPEILNEDNNDEVTLKALLDLMIFKVPRENDPIFKEWEREAKRAKMSKDLKKAKVKSTNPVVSIDGRQLKNAMTDYNKMMVVKKNEKN